MPQSQQPIIPVHSGSLSTINGTKSALNVIAAANIFTGGGYVCRIKINAAGSAGNLTVNDSATTGAAATANVIYTIAYTGLTAGQDVVMQFPVTNGLTVSAIPTGGVIAISYTN